MKNMTRKEALHKISIIGLSPGYPRIFRKETIPAKAPPLNRHIKDRPHPLMRPYYTYKVQHKYIIYLDPSVNNRVPEQNIQASDDWKRWRGISYYYGNKKNASLRTAFVGTGVRLHLKDFQNAGKVGFV